MPRLESRPWSDAARGPDGRVGCEQPTRPGGRAVGDDSRGVPFPTLSCTSRSPTARRHGRRDRSSASSRPRRRLRLRMPERGRGRAIPTATAGPTLPSAPPLRTAPTCRSSASPPGRSRSFSAVVPASSRPAPADVGTTRTARCQRSRRDQRPFQGRPRSSRIQGVTRATCSSAPPRGARAAVVGPGAREALRRRHDPSAGLALNGAHRRGQPEPPSEQPGRERVSPL
jgi:hypothetical protein